MCEQTDNPTKNTDRELWREDVTDRPANTLFITEGGGIGMNCGGMVIVMPLRKWHDLAWKHAPLSNR